MIIDYTRFEFKFLNFQICNLCWQKEMIIFHYMWQMFLFVLSLFYIDHFSLFIQIGSNKLYFIQQTNLSSMFCLFCIDHVSLFIQIGSNKLYFIQQTNLSSMFCLFHINHFSLFIQIRSNKLHFIQQTNLSSMFCLFYIDHFSLFIQFRWNIITLYNNLNFHPRFVFFSMDHFSLFIQIGSSMSWFIQKTEKLESIIWLFYIIHLSFFIRIKRIILHRQTVE